MASIQVNITVTQHGNIMAELNGAEDEGIPEDQQWQRVVKKQATCCDRCAVNENPDRVPMHVLCHCYVVIERVR